MTTRAYAKINLGLRILRRREDGYHDIETVFHRINLFDEITFEPSSTISLTTNHHELPTDDRNLCVRAAGLLQKTCGIHQGVHITLKKEIPIGAGLGGGSSDAAVVLTALPFWWGEKMQEGELHRLAFELGADVPYFLKPGTAHATGKGEVLEYFELALPYWIIVVYPNLHISTSWAYANTQLRRRGEERSLKDILLEHLSQPRMLTSLLQNDFEPLVLRTYPQVANLRKLLYDRGAVFAQLSGSGSSLFGLFIDEDLAKKAASDFRSEYPTFLTPPHFTIPQDTNLRTDSEARSE